MTPEEWLKRLLVLCDWMQEAVGGPDLRKLEKVKDGLEDLLHHPLASGEKE